MNGDPENRSESGSEEGEHRHRQLANGIKNQRITKAQDRILNRMAKFTKRMPLPARAADTFLDRFLDCPSHSHAPSPRCCPASPSRCPRRPDPSSSRIAANVLRTPPPAAPHAPPSASSARTPVFSNAHNTHTQAGCAKGNRGSERVWNSVQYPPVTPSNVAPGLR